MYIHTVIPLETVFQGLDTMTYENRKVVNYRGVSMEVERQTDKLNPCYRILRIYSTNIFDYMRADIQPGMLIEEAL